MNVPVEHSHRAESLQQIEGLRAVLGCPAPLRVDGPQGNMRENHDRGAAPMLGDIVLEPSQLLVSNRTHPFELRSIVQADEMDPFVIEALPTPPRGAFAKTLQVLLAVVT